jgi:tetratricopeptide (TPR) repeat protein
MSDFDINEKLQSLLDGAVREFLVGNHNESINRLKSALMLDRENPVILFNLAVNYCRIGLYKTAIEYLQKLESLSLAYIEGGTVKKIYAFSLIQLGDYIVAAKILDDILTSITGDQQAESMLAYIYEKQGKYDKAAELYRGIIERDPECFSAFNSLAYVLAKSGKDLKLALQYVQRAMKTKNNNPAMLDTAGYILMKMKRLKEAEKFITNAYLLAPFSTEIKEHLKEIKTIGNALNNK